MTIVVATSVYLWMTTSILVYWLFGFKYWVIAVEVPNYLADPEKPGNSEIYYQRINSIAIATILVVCGVACFYRGTYVHQSVGIPHYPTEVFLWTLTGLYAIVCVLMIVTACFLGDALSKLRKQIKEA